LKSNEREKRPKKQKGISSHQLVNMKIENGIECYTSGAKSKVVAKILGIKLSQLKKCLYKKSTGLNPVIEIRQQPAKIRRGYLEFIDNYLQTPRNIFTFLYSLKTLIIGRFQLEKIPFQQN